MANTKLLEIQSDDWNRKLWLDKYAETLVLTIGRPKDSDFPSSALAIPLNKEELKQIRAILNIVIDENLDDPKPKKQSKPQCTDTNIIEKVGVVKVIQCTLKEGHRGYHSKGNRLWGKADESR